MAVPARQGYIYDLALKFRAFLLIHLWKDRIKGFKLNHFSVHSGADLGRKIKPRVFTQVNKLPAILAAVTDLIMPGVSIPWRDWPVINVP